MAGSLLDRVSCWIAWGGIDERFAPPLDALEKGFSRNGESCREGADPRSIADWEERHGYQLPHGLQAWLKLFERPVPGWSVHSPDHRDRADDLLCADAGDAGAAGKLVRAGEPEPADDLHRPGVPAAGRGVSDLHLGRRRIRQCRHGSLPGALRSGFWSCCGGRDGSTGSTLNSVISGTRGIRTYATLKSPRCRTGYNAIGTGWRR